MKNKYDLEERLINYAVQILDSVQDMPNTKVANHLGGQLMRSGTSPALNYGEAQSGESKKDFIHKMKICLKELRETIVCLKIIQRSKLYGNDEKLLIVIDKNNQLISIFVKSVETAVKNDEKQKNNFEHRLTNDE